MELQSSFGLFVYCANDLRMVFFIFIILHLKARMSICKWDLCGGWFIGSGQTRRNVKIVASMQQTATSKMQGKQEGHLSDQIQRLTITQPDDWHLHLRDGDGLASVAPLR